MEPLSEVEHLSDHPDLPPIGKVRCLNNSDTHTSILIDFLIAAIVLKNRFLHLKLFIHRVAQGGNTEIPQ